jgi:hypothetical protein
MRQLKSARSDLQQAYGRLEAKRRGHRRRKLLMLAGLSTLASLPQVRARLLRTLSIVSTRYSLPGATRLATSGRANSPRPDRLEDLTKEDLYARAQDADIPGRSEMSKDELIEGPAGKELVEAGLTPAGGCERLSLLRLVDLRVCGPRHFWGLRG